MFISKYDNIMGCNCEPKKYSISMGCCEPVLGPIENYYTKYAIDKMLEEIESGITSGCCITPEEVDEKIDEAISGITPCDLSEYWTSAETQSAITSAMTIVEGEIPSLSGYATEQWVEDKHYITGVDLSDYATKEEIPSLSGYATEQWVFDKHYITGMDLSDYVTFEDLPSLSGYATEEWVEDKHYITGVDLSDYATKEEIPDVSNYYNKTEIDNKFESASTFNPDQYYSKSQADDRFALKSEIPTLTGYATTEWVTNMNYVTNSTLQQYITNLQQQITSIIQSVSGCCSDTGETIYRWITLTGPNDFMCSGTTKYEKQQKQESTDNGMSWTNVSPAEYQRGSVLETNSSACGYVPEPQYRWKAAPTSDYMCSGTSKYYKVYYEVSTDGGQTWVHVSPEETRRGDLIEANSTDCGYIAPQYRWKAAPTSDYMCSGTSKYYKVYYEVSTDGGSTWAHVSPEQTKRGDLIEANSTDCGYIAPQYRWHTSQSEYICSGTTKYRKQYYQVSTDGGSTWSNVSPTQTRRGTVMQYNSTDCGYVPPVTCDTPIARVTNTGSDTWYDICDISGNSAVTRTDVESSLTTTQFNNIHTLQILETCTKIDDNAFKGITSLRMIGNMGYNVRTIGKAAFSGCTNLREVVYIGCNITKIDNNAFKNCTNMTGVEICTTTPPTLGTTVFDNTNNCPIYVPSSAVNTFKNASGWSAYASRIRAMS